MGAARSTLNTRQSQYTVLIFGCVCVALLQRGLRMNPCNAELYFQYLRMELLYMLKLRERRRVLDAVGGKDLQLLDGSEDAKHRFDSHLCCACTLRANS